MTETIIYSDFITQTKAKISVLMRYIWELGVKSYDG